MVLKNWFKGLKHSLSTHKYKLLMSLIFLSAAVAIYAISGDFVSDHNWSAVSDVILNNIGPYNLSFIFVWLLVLVVVVFIAYPLIYQTDKLPYAITILSFFLVIRSVFMLFTHLGAPIDAIKVNAPSLLQFLTFTNDLFFSGHTGLPFLGYLIFRKDNKWIKTFMFISSIIMAITVLLMHIHYSIDVLAAFFITYGIYKIGDSWIKSWGSK